MSAIKNFTKKVKENIDNGIISEGVDINKALIYATEKKYYDTIIKLLDLGASFYYTNNKREIEKKKKNKDAEQRRNYGTF